MTGMPHMKSLNLAIAATLALAAGAAHAEDANWTGFHVGVVGGYAVRSESSGESIGFDTNLDGKFDNTVNNAAGANAFSTGFCGGAFNTNAAPGGCRGDDKSDIEIGVRAGYDYQFAGNWVVGGVVEYTQLQLQDAVTAFSITPAAYTFTRKLRDTIAIRARAGYALGDNQLYIAFEPMGKGAVTLSPGAPAGCRVAAIEPEMDEQQKKLQDAFGRMGGQVMGSPAKAMQVVCGAP